MRASALCLFLLLVFLSLAAGAPDFARQASHFLSAGAERK